MDRKQLVIKTLAKAKKYRDLAWRIVATEKRLTAY
jgi:hypothetical protein